MSALLVIPRLFFKFEMADSWDDADLLAEMQLQTPPGVSLSLQADTGTNGIMHGSSAPRADTGTCGIMHGSAPRIAKRPASRIAKRRRTAAEKGRGDEGPASSSSKGSSKYMPELRKEGFVVPLETLQNSVVDLVDGDDKDKQDLADLVPRARQAPIPAWDSAAFDDRLGPETPGVSSSSAPPPAATGSKRAPATSTERLDDDGEHRALGRRVRPRVIGRRLREPGMCGWWCKAALDLNGARYCMCDVGPTWS